MKKAVLFFGTAAVAGICAGVALMFKYCSKCTLKKQAELNKVEGKGTCSCGRHGDTCDGTCKCNDKSGMSEKRKSLFDKYNVLMQGEPSVEAQELIDAINKVNMPADNSSYLVFDESNEPTNEVTEFDADKINLVEETEGTAAVSETSDIEEDIADMLSPTTEEDEVTDEEIAKQLLALGEGESAD